MFRLCWPANIARILDPILQTNDSVNISQFYQKRNKQTKYFSNEKFSDWKVVIYKVSIEN